MKEYDDGALKEGLMKELDKSEDEEEPLDEDKNPFEYRFKFFEDKKRKRKKDKGNDSNANIDKLVKKMNKASVSDLKLLQEGKPATNKTFLVDDVTEHLKNRDNQYMFLDHKGLKALS